MSNGDLAHQLFYDVSKKSKTILVIGDGMTDVWLHGHFRSCQDDCDKFVVTERYETPGGAANAADCLRGWNARVGLYSALDSTSWTRKTRLIDSSGKIVLRVDEDKRGSLSVWKQSTLLETVSRAGACLLSDYDKGTLAPDIVRSLINSCVKNGVPCVVDAKRDPALYAGCIIKCNNDYYNLHQNALLNVYPLVRTFGPQSPDVYTRPVSDTIPQLPPVHCVNHVGAGDCFAAHFTLALAYGLPLRDAAMLAHSAGRVYVSRSRRYPVMPSEVAADMDSGGAGDRQASCAAPQGVLDGDVGG